MAWWNVHTSMEFFCRPSLLDQALLAQRASRFTHSLGGSGLHLYTEIRYHHAFTNKVDTTVMPLTFGIRFYGVKTSSSLVRLTGSRVASKPIVCITEALKQQGRKSVSILRKLGAFGVMVASLSSQIFSQTVEVRAKPITDADVKLLRQDLQSLKNQVITDTMQFNEKEAAAFWPVYKDYSTAQHSIADKRLGIITDYAKSLDNMDDNTARSLTERMFALEGETQNLRKEYFPRFEKALGAKRAAKFYQVDNRLSEMVNLQITSEVPLIP